MKALCPYCNYELTCEKETLGLNCPACDCRVINRNGSLLTIEQAKAHGCQEASKVISQISNDQPSEVRAKVSEITREAFNPNLHVAEYKRICNSCGKIWHSLASREQELSKKSQRRVACCQTMEALRQEERNIDASKDSLDKLRKCPVCGSANYKEATLYYEKHP